MKIFTTIFFFILASVAFSSCEFLGDIFKAGVWVGVIIVIAAIAVIAFLVKIFSK